VWKRCMIFGAPRRVVQLSSRLKAIIYVLKDLKSRLEERQRRSTITV